MHEAALAQLRARPDSALLTHEAGANSTLSGAAESSPHPKPWDGEAGRVDFGLPFAAPFEDATVAVVHCVVDSVL